MLSSPEISRSCEGTANRCFTCRCVAARGYAFAARAGSRPVWDTASQYEPGSRFASRLPRIAASLSGQTHSCGRSFACNSPKVTLSGSYCERSRSAGPPSGSRRPSALNPWLLAAGVVLDLLFGDPHYRGASRTSDGPEFGADRRGPAEELRMDGYAGRILLFLLLGMLWVGRCIRTGRGRFPHCRRLHGLAGCS